MYRTFISDFANQWGDFESERFSVIFKSFKKTHYFRTFLDNHDDYKALLEDQKNLLVNTVMLGNFQSYNIPILWRIYQVLALGEPDENCIQLKQVIIDVNDDFNEWNYNYYGEQGILIRDCNKIFKELGIKYENTYIHVLFKREKVSSGLIKGLPKTELAEQMDGFEPNVYKGMRYTTKTDIEEYISKHHRNVRFGRHLDAIIDELIKEKPSFQSKN